MKYRFIALAFLLSSCIPQVQLQERGVQRNTVVGLPCPGCIRIYNTLQRKPPIPIENVGRSVEPGVVTDAKAGSVIYSEFNYRSIREVSLIRRLDNTFGLGAHVVVPANIPLIRATVRGQTGYCTGFAAYTEPLGPDATKSVCLFDDDANGTFERYWILGTIASSARTIAGVPYQSREVWSGVGGYKYELLYQGRSGNAVHMEYREFIQDPAKPAFQQPLTYRLNRRGATRVAFRQASLEVLSANSGSIRFRVLRGFK